MCQDALILHASSVGWRVCLSIVVASDNQDGRCRVAHGWFTTPRTTSGQILTLLAEFQVYSVPLQFGAGSPVLAVVCESFTRRSMQGAAAIIGAPFHACTCRDPVFIPMLGAAWSEYRPTILSQYDKFAGYVHGLPPLSCSAALSTCLNNAGILQIPGLAWGLRDTYRDFEPGA